MIEEVKMYSVVCNNCKKAYYDEHNGIVAWSDKEGANEMATNADWYKDGDEHYCTECYTIDDDDKLILKEVSDE